MLLKVTRMKLKSGGDHGAGFAAMAMSSWKSLNPYNWKKKYDQYQSNVANKSASLSEYEQDMAALAKQGYGAHESRNHHKDYEYQKELSGHNYAVYRNHKTNKNYMVFKGTSDKEDLLPDAAILYGYQNLNGTFKNANEAYQILKPKLEGDWETIGHSLGGTKAMYVAQQNNIQSHAFNPGYNNYADDQINTNYKGHNVYVRQGDPISNSILTEDISNLKILPSAGYSPLTNHSIDSF